MQMHLSSLEQHLKIDTNKRSIVTYLMQFMSDVVPSIYSGKWLQYAYSSVFSNTSGVPQGCVLSSLLIHLFISHIDKILPSRGTILPIMIILRRGKSKLMKAFLVPHVEEIGGNYQRGFRNGKSTTEPLNTDTIHTISSLTSKPHMIT